MRKRSRLVLALMLWIASAINVHGEAVESREPFLPLAKARINVPSQDQDALIQLVDSFAQSHHFLTEGNNFPRFGGHVVEREMDITGKPNQRRTFFMLGNFRNQNVFELVAYSHESKDVWWVPWNELISLIAARFGEATIVQVEGPPAQNAKPNTHTASPNASDNRDQVPPPPVAFTTIKIRKGTRDDVLQLLRNFINEHHFGTEQADTQIDGRLTIYRKIVVDTDTFFVVDNTLDESEMVLFGFSRVPDGAWRQWWQELTAKMSIEFSTSQ
jgi:hypothetical protein